MYLKTYSIEDMYHYEFPAVQTGIHLRDYQIRGRDWLEEKERAILADDAGLGKTIQASEAAKAHKPVLISAPTYLTQQWYDHLTRQYPDDKVVLATGNIHRFDRQARLKVKADWTIINHQMFRPGAFKLPKVKTVILDESHHFRNRTALQSVGAVKFTENRNLRVYCLSATPMWKSVEDIWNQLHILQPDIFNSYKDFMDYYLIVDETAYGPKILGVKRQVKRELEALLSIVKFGRKYKDVGRSLPQVIDNQINIEFPPAVQKIYDQLKSKYRLQLLEDETLVFGSYIEVMHTLRMITNFPGKQEACRDRIEDIDKPTIVFSWYVDTAHNLQKSIPNSILLTGALDPQERHGQAMLAMKNGKHIIATMASLGEGINLQGYRHVIFYECDWAPGRNYQAVSRVVRDRNDEGRDKEPVLVDYIKVIKSIDDVIYKVSQRRSVSIRDVMAGILI